MVTKKKMRKSSQELAIEIKEREANEKELLKLVEEKRKLIEIKTKQLELVQVKLKTDIIREVGEYMETHTHKDKIGKISTDLRKLFKGSIHESTIWEVCYHEKNNWIDKDSKAYGHKGANQYTAKSGSSASKKELSQQEQEYLQAYEDEVKRNKQIAELIQTLTGLTIEQQAKIISQTPKGEDFRKKLVEASKGYMLKIAKQMIRSDIRIMLGDLRTLNYLTDEFGDILYEEEETRKRREPLESA